MQPDTTPIEADALSREPHMAVQLVPAEPTQEMREMRCCHG